METFWENESKVSDRAGSYRDLTLEALLTSEEDFRRIFNALEIESWAELGCGYGWGCLLFSELYPEKLCIGLEFEGPRIQVAKTQAQMKGLKAQFIHADLATCEIPVVQTYFLYFPTGPVLDRILCELGKATHDFQLIVIESHGDFLPRLSLEDWLTPVQEIPLLGQRHYPYAVVFKKTGRKKASYFDFSFQDRLLLVRDEQGEWLAESRGLEFLTKDQIQFQTPPRTVKTSSILGPVQKEELPQAIVSKLQERRENSLWRKIYLRPDLLVEDLEGRIWPLL